MQLGAAAVRGVLVESAGRVHCAAVGIRAGLCLQREHSDHVARGGAFPRDGTSVTKTSDADAELGAYGIANICAGMFGAPMSVGIPARSLAVVRCGGSTRVANLVHAVVLGVILWLGSGVVSHIPLPALAGVTAWMGLVPAGLERVAAAAEDEPRGCRGIPGHGAFGAGVNAVLAVAIGCSMYGLKFVYVRWVRPRVESSGFASGLVSGGTGPLPACRSFKSRNSERSWSKISYRGRSVYDSEDYFLRRVVRRGSVVPIVSGRGSRHGPRRLRQVDRRSQGDAGG